MNAIPSTQPLPVRRRLGDRLGDWLLYGLTAAATAASVVLLGAIVWKIFEVAWPAIEKFGLDFVTRQGWDVQKNVFGALDFIWGTAITSFLALLIAAPVSIANVKVETGNVLAAAKSATVRCDIANASPFDAQHVTRISEA